MATTEKKDVKKPDAKASTSAPAADPPDKAAQADKIINKYSLFAGGTGFIPVPVLDIVGIGALQYQMVRELAKVYGVDFKLKLVKTIVTSIAGSAGTKSVAASTGGILKVIPGIGSALAGSALAIYATAATYGIGKAFVQHFESGGTLGDVDLQSMGESFQAFFSKKKEAA